MPDTPPQDILTLIVTWQGAESISRTVRSCCASGSDQRILIIDNASCDGTVALVEQLGLSNVTIFKLPANQGVARAYNIGLQEALGSKTKWLFILDQDSICHSRCPAILRQSGEKLIRSGEKVAAVCPTARCRAFPDVIHHPLFWTGRGLRAVDAPAVGDKPVAIDSAISAGTLYQTEALAAVDGFREDYFIDFVDHDCNLRLRNAGWSLWWERKAELYQRLGRVQRLVEEGLWIEHAPFRYYYMARNMTDGYRRFGGPRALASFLGEALGHMKRLRKYGANPRQSIFYLLKGIGDALIGKFGPLDSAP